LLDGIAFIANGVVTAEGDHALDISAFDQAGNSSRRVIQFAIDRTPPVVTLTGFVDGSFVKSDVTPEFTASDANLLSVEAGLDGVASFASGTHVGSEGTHHILVTALDKAGNHATR